MDGNSSPPKKVRTFRSAPLGLFDMKLDNKCIFGIAKPEKPQHTETYVRISKGKHDAKNACYTATA